MSISENLNTDLEAQNDAAAENESSTTNVDEKSNATEPEAAETSNINEPDATNETEVNENEVPTKEATPEKSIEIPVEDYAAFGQEELLASLKKLSNSYPVQLIKDQVEDIRKFFNKNFDEKAAKSKEAFIAEGGNEIDFYFTTPLKREFNELYFNYKDKKNDYYKTLKTNLEKNLKHRLELIEQLKELISSNETVNKKFNIFKDIKEHWHQAGAIPRDQNNVVWNTFYHHVDKFYEIIHLDREFRDLDYKHNLEQKVKIIERAKELTQETNINRAFRELQVLHKIWKEEIGPVAKEYKDLIWDKFSELTREIHDNRQAHYAEQDAKQEENLAGRKEIINQINQLTEVPKNNHNDWQKAMKQVEELHDKFKKVGRVPNEFKNSIWDEFRAAERNFNKAKNEFYKQIKGDQLDNLKKKRDLIATAEANKDSDDFDIVTPLMKRIQSEWKSIGHVPRKDSDKVWKQFKDACNHYFDRINNKKEATSAAQEEALEKKVEFIDTLKSFEVTDLESVISKINEWKTLGSVPYKKRKIEEEFSQILDAMFAKLNLNKKEAELIKFDNKLAEITAQNNERLLLDEKSFIRKRMDELKSEILQLENNLQFFKHADKSNPMVADVYKKIDKFQNDLSLWKEKWAKIKSL
ncbi:DUF349 domain-containing protein [Aquimarina agarilytica]|uniref:DUF349 domain-containing protein n=1 Tax=Aquimarina agarilytica TaxID=1087449 RepID=UPI0002886C13|nr:DUF349 domain-containing protein [Aquimarina agarilytica]